MRALVGIVAVVLLAGCLSMRHGYGVGQVAGKVLPLSSDEAAQRLALEEEYDPALRSFVREQGSPQYLYVIDARNLHLIYTDRDFSARFAREWGPVSIVEKLDPIPEELRMRLPRHERRKLARGRSSRR